MSAFRQTIGPAYLFACIVMGGSAKGIFSNLALQLIGLAVLAWAFLAKPGVELSRDGRRIAWLAAAAVGLVVVQLIPLLPAIWSNLPGRSMVVEGFAQLGQGLPWMPLSLDPTQTLATAMAMIPPLAMLALILRLGAYRERWLIAALLLATCLSVGLGIVQLQGGGTGPYLYPQSNLGTASGLFANANHMATLLLAAAPFLLAFAIRRWREGATSSDNFLTAIFAGSIAIVLIIGAAANHSFALIVIGVPLVIVSAISIVPAGFALGKWRLAVILLIISGIAAIALLAATTDLDTANRTSVALRSEIWATTLDAIRTFNVAGSGIGTFPHIYPGFEDPATVERTYVNHAHNDYLELALEGGMAAVALMALFLFWWGTRVVALWRSRDADPIGQAASIASAAILLHSLVDYPLRTAGIASVFAMAIGLMARPKPKREQKQLSELRPTRHLTL